MYLSSGNTRPRETRYAGRIVVEIFRNNYSASPPQPVHAHDETTITIVLQGAIRERVGRIEESAGPLSYVVKPQGTRHSNSFSPFVQTVQVVISGDHVSSLESANPTLNDWRWHHGGPALRPLLALARELAAPKSQWNSRPQLDLYTADLIGALGWSGKLRSGTPPRWLELIRQELDESGRATSVRDLATGAGVHPVYLARKFRAWFGCSITQHLRRRQLRKAADALGRAPRTISGASYAAGFADHSHLCRVFRGETGVTPTVFRQLVSQAVPTVQDSSGSPAILRCPQSESRKWRTQDFSHV